MKLLCNFAVGERGRVTAVGGEGRVRRRLFDMGVTPGADVVLVKRRRWATPWKLRCAAISSR